MPLLHLISLIYYTNSKNDLADLLPTSYKKAKSKKMVADLCQYLSGWSTELSRSLSWSNIVVKLLI